MLGEKSHRSGQISSKFSEIRFTHCPRKTGPRTPRVLVRKGKESEGRGQGPGSGQ